MYYTVYKITNRTNGKIYIGCHKTKKLDDDYMGSGKNIKRAHEKYGIENFEKEILEIYDNSDEMFAKEKELVNKEFINREDTYNLKEGGDGGYDHLNNGSIEQIERCIAAGKKTDQHNSFERIRWLRKNDAEWCEKYKKNISNGLKKFFKNGGKPSFEGKKHSDESKQKMSESKKGKYVGEKNPSYGTMWIHSLKEKRSKKINKEDFSEWEAKGWLKGRKMKFL